MRREFLIEVIAMIIKCLSMPVLYLPTDHSWETKLQISSVILFVEAQPPQYSLHAYLK